MYTFHIKTKKNLFIFLNVILGCEHYKFIIYAYINKRYEHQQNIKIQEISFSINSSQNSVEQKLSFAYYYEL